mmetsp:Transcript_17441/g.49396  ORF Transcript_17441/g.49396 Transcript_17441/m.49396 type:complete len:326 (-) Transcript_17441:227-1204(-)
MKGGAPPIGDAGWKGGLPPSGLPAPAAGGAKVGPIGAKAGAGAGTVAAIAGAASGAGAGAAIGASTGALTGTGAAGTGVTLAGGGKDIPDGAAGASSSSSPSSAGGGVAFTARPVASAKPRKRPLTPMPEPALAASVDPPAPPCGARSSLSSRMLRRKASESLFWGTALTKCCSKVTYLRALSVSPTSASRVAWANLKGWIVGKSVSALPTRTAYSKASDRCRASGSSRLAKFSGLRCSTPSRQTRLDGASTASRVRSPVSSWHRWAPKVSPSLQRPAARSSRNLVASPARPPCRSAVQTSPASAGHRARTDGVNSGGAPLPSTS